MKYLIEITCRKISDKHTINFKILDASYYSKISIEIRILIWKMHCSGLKMRTLKSHVNYSKYLCLCICLVEYQL